MNTNLCSYTGVNPAIRCSVAMLGWSFRWEPIASDLPALTDGEKKELLYRLNKYAMPQGEQDPGRIKAKRRAKAIVKKFLRELNR